MSYFLLVEQIFLESKWLPYAAMIHLVCCFCLVLNEKCEFHWTTLQLYRNHISICHHTFCIANCECVKYQCLVSPRSLNSLNLSLCVFPVYLFPFLVQLQPVYVFPLQRLFEALKPNWKPSRLDCVYASLYVYLCIDVYISSSI